MWHFYGLDLCKYSLYIASFFVRSFLEAAIECAGALTLYIVVINGDIHNRRHLNTALATAE